MSGCSIPHRLALLATSPVATGEAKLEEPRKGTETRKKPRSCIGYQII